MASEVTKIAFHFDFLAQSLAKVLRALVYRCMIMNRSPYPLETFVKLRGSPDYKFIHVEEYGYVVSYSPRLSGGDHHHLIWVRAEDEVEVHLPIAPQVIIIKC